MVSWQCPRCLRQLEALTELKMFWLVSAHIRGHEDCAALRAVEAALAFYPVDPYAVRRPVGLTDYDQRLLRGMNIRWYEGEKAKSEEKG